MIYSIVKYNTNTNNNVYNLKKIYYNMHIQINYHCKIKIFAPRRIGPYKSIIYYE